MDAQFSSDGNGIVSGGQECVLVHTLWKGELFNLMKLTSLEFRWKIFEFWVEILTLAAKYFRENYGSIA